MAATEAQIRANRENARKSTGPTSREGKDRVRSNAIKHGLTGSGVALPTEDQEAIGRLFTSMQVQLAPSTDVSEKLVRRAAFLFVRLERCEKHETSQVASKVRHAVAAFDDRRLVEVETLAARIYDEPATTARRLQATPEGIDWLLDQWETLQADLLKLKTEGRECWTGNHWARLEMLQGRNPADYRIGRTKALSDAVTGFFAHLDKADGEGLEGPARSEWARSELARLIDEEIARLKHARVKHDPRAIAADRAEAADRALFDPSPEMILARKYQAATERSLYKALKEFRQAEAEAKERRESNIIVDTEETYDPAALNLPEPEDEAEEDEPEPTSGPKSAPPTILVLPERAEEGPISVETAWDGAV